MINRQLRALEAHFDAITSRGIAALIVGLSIQRALVPNRNTRASTSELLKRVSESN
jgi:hypothetical protein